MKIGRVLITETINPHAKQKTCLATLGRCPAMQSSKHNPTHVHLYKKSSELNQDSIFYFTTFAIHRVLSISYLLPASAVYFAWFKHRFASRTFEFFFFPVTKLHISTPPFKPRFARQARSTLVPQHHRQQPKVPKRRLASSSSSSSKTPTHHRPRNSHLSQPLSANPYPSST